MEGGFFGLLAVFVLTTGFLTYALIDSAVSYTYLTSSFDQERQANVALGQLVVAGSKSYTKKDILHLLRQAKPTAFIVEEGNKVWFEGVLFRFESDRLVRVGEDA